MSTRSIFGILALLLQLSALPSRAFSLIGPFSTWQTPDIGYDLPGVDAGVDDGGPRYRGDEYRLSTPIVTFGFDGSFVEFFGAPGMQAAQDAFSVFNSLTNVSAMSTDLSEFPLKADGVNPLAQTLGLVDLKTTVMTRTLEMLGLTTPDRWMWALRARFVDGGGVPHYSVLNMNYDPVTGLPSRYVNGTLYSYVIREVIGPGNAVIGYDSREIPIDAAFPNIALASMSRRDRDEVLSGRLETAVNEYGRYFAGLTRDDAGGLRYLYHPANRNYEAAPVGSVRGSGTVTSIGNNAALDSPWTIVGGSTTIGTNAVGTGATGTQRQLVNLGVRAGVDHVRFVRVDLDPILRVSPAPVVVSYPELVVSNGLVISQIVLRTNTQPDILLSAGDLGVAQWVPLYLQFGLTYANNGALLSGNAEGPGNIEPNVTLRLSKVGLFTTNDGNSDEQDGSRGLIWGSFDGSTNTPIAYPIGSRLEDIEAAVLLPSQN